MSAPLHDLTGPRPDSDQILASVARLVAEVVGEGYDLGLDRGRETSFAAHIEIESIEFVGLCELLVEEYGERVDLIAWFGELDVDQIIGLTVGDLVDYIATSLSGDGTGR